MVLPIGEKPQMGAGGIDQIYQVRIEKARDRRTLRQNDLLWWTYRLEADLINGNNIGEGTVTPEELYCADIMHNTDGVPVVVRPEAVEALKAVFRVVQPVKRIYRRGKEYVVAQCWVGSSKWDKAKMAAFIDYRMRRLAEYGVDVCSYPVVKLYRQEDE